LLSNALSPLLLGSKWAYTFENEQTPSSNMATGTDAEKEYACRTLGLWAGVRDAAWPRCLVSVGYAVGNAVGYADCVSIDWISDDEKKSLL
jgi:hypothetical protein